MNSWDKERTIESSVSVVELNWNIFIVSLKRHDANTVKLLKIVPTTGLRRIYVCFTNGEPMNIQSNDIKYREHQTNVKLSDLSLWFLTIEEASTYSRSFTNEVYHCINSSQLIGLWFLDCLDTIIPIIAKDHCKVQVPLLLGGGPRNPGAHSSNK